jgi:hypothetical protein
MRRILYLLILLFLITACGTFENSTIYDHKVRYFSSTIINAERNVITLANQSVWEVDHLTTIVEMSPVLVVLEENINVGNMYVNNQKYGIRGGFTDDFFFKYGYLQIFQNYDPKTKTITLINNSKWQIPAEFAPFVERWLPGSEVIITEDEHFMINARKREKTPVRRIFSDKTRSKKIKRNLIKSKHSS